MGNSLAGMYGAKYCYLHQEWSDYYHNTTDWKDF
jgi:hypothetical protein